MGQVEGIKNVIKLLHEREKHTLYFVRIVKVYNKTKNIKIKLRSLYNLAAYNRKYRRFQRYFGYHKMIK